MAIEIARALGACGLVTLAGYGAGLWVRTPDLGRLERLAMRMLAGFGLLGVGLFLVGLARWSGWTVLPVLVVPALLGVWQLVREERFRVDRSLWYYSVALAMVAVCAVAALSRPAGDIGNDAISYHLLGPAKWPGLGRIVPILDHSHTAFPATVEVLFAAGMLAGNDRVPGLLDVVFTLIFLAQIRGLAAALNPGERTGTLAVTVAATMPVIMLFSNNGFVDIAFACFTLAGLRFGMEVCEGRLGAREAGLFAGFAVGTKYTGILFAAILVAAVFAFRPKAKTALGIAGLAAVVGCTWYARNWLVLGSPIYPIPLALARFFHSPYFPMPAVLHFDSYILERGKGVGRGLQWLLALPFTFTFFTAAFQGGGGIGLMPICFGPAGVLAVWRDRRARFLCAAALLTTAAWFFTQQEARFLIPVVGLSAVAAATGATSLLWQPGRLGRAVCWAALAVSVLYGAGFILQAERPKLASLAGREPEIPYRRAFAFLNGSAQVRRVLVLDATVPVYYLSKEYVKPRGPYGELSVTPAAATDPLSQVGALRITHVLDTRSKVFGTRFQVDGSAGWRLVFEEGDARVYAVEKD